MIHIGVLTLLIYVTASMTASMLDLVMHCPSHCLEACHHTVLLLGNLPAECPLLLKQVHTHTHHKTSSVVKECVWPGISIIRFQGQQDGPGGVWGGVGCEAITAQTWQPEFHHQTSGKMEGA